MLLKEEVLLLNGYENEILEIIYNQDEYTTSDLQGRVTAIVMNIFKEGKRLKTEK